MTPAPRRSPAPDERRRDPERTREALLDAALAEFAAHGVAGARVSEIAARAGVNKQLISYYFGGKDGLHRALVERWHEQEAAFSGPDVPLEELVCRYLEVNRRQPDALRFFLRQAIDEDPASVAFEPDAEELEDVRRRQREGEIGEDLDPAFVLLVLQAAVASGAVFPGDVRRLMGVDPSSDAFYERMGEQLRRLVRRLA